MKNTIKVFVLVALTLAAMSVSAQVKLGHIETQKLIQAMPEWTAAQKTFEEEQKKVNTELNGLREQFQTKLAEYSEKMKTYSEAMRATTEEELQGLQQRIQRFHTIFKIINHRNPISTISTKFISFIITNASSRSTL